MFADSNSQQSPNGINTTFIIRTNTLDNFVSELLSTKLLSCWLTSYYWCDSCVIGILITTLIKYVSTIWIIRVYLVNIYNICNAHELVVDSDPHIFSQFIEQSMTHSPGTHLYVD